VPGDGIYGDMGTGGATESAASIRHLIRAAAEYGLVLDEGPSAREPTFRARVGVGHAQRLWERAARELGPAMPLVVARKRPDDHISPLFFAAKSCATLDYALRLTVQYWRYATDAVSATMISSGETVRLRLGVDGPPSLGARLGVEYLLADLTRSGRELGGAGWHPVQLVLSHRPPVGLATWEAACGLPVCVDPAAPGLVMSRGSLECHVRSPLGPAAGKLFREVLDAFTPIAARAPTFAQRVAERLADGVGGARPSVDDVARELGLSTRSLHRRLAGEGASYRQLADRARRDEAIRRIADEEHQIKAIARAIGFSDPRGFRRAFLRWTGLTPRQFRTRHHRARVQPAMGRQPRRQCR
jgi:AraC-like DNA-binding protein